MTSSTDAPVVRTDPFPALGELLLPVASAGSHGGILDELRARAEAEGRRAGYEQGRQDGFDRGLAEARSLVGERVDAVLASIEEAVARSQADDALVAASLGNAVVTAALEIAEAVLGREVALAESPGRDALVRALVAAPPTGHLVARLHPVDAELVAASDLPGSERRTIEIVGDPAIEPGGCVLDTPTGQVDALLSTALSRVAEALTGAPQDGGTA